MYLISPKVPQYKANLHSHSTLSDGSLTPVELRDMYKAQGYSILAITDHEYPNDHTSLGDDELLMLTGYEAYIRPSPDCRYDVYSPEVHLNLFARDPHNTTLICYNKACCKYIPEEKQADIPRAGSERTRAYNREYINEFIRTARDNGYIVSYNHPYWSMESEADIIATEGCFSMEMVNYNSYVSSRLEHNGALYDRFLSAGKRIFCHGADDNHNRFPAGHPGFDSFGGFTMIMADSLSYDSIFSAMESGNMYSSMGPEIRSAEYRDGTVHVECSPATAIIAYTGRKHPKHFLAPLGETVTSADIEIDGDARYLRLSVVDREGRWADTRGYSRDELGL
ncbi:MAG: PHP domain-containing protein [Ruminococcaceae bacterium]|nr:PHP domain-containing protein [Oscillospiraceae bacterium]